MALKIFAINFDGSVEFEVEVVAGTLLSTSRLEVSIFLMVELDSVKLHLVDDFEEFLIRVHRPPMGSLTGGYYF